MHVACVVRAVSWAAIVAVPPLGAQSIHVADSLLAAGSIARAESVYYAMARIRPRDPMARWALGKYLVERGAWRVGATLLEESLQFGGDPVLVGRELLSAYLQVREFAPLAGLAAASPSQRERARWLTTHEPRFVAPDSIVAVPFLQSADSGVLGSVAIRVNGVAIVAVLNPETRGIVVSRGVLGARHPRFFAAGIDTTAEGDVLAVADSVSIGRLTMLNQPVTVATLPAGSQAIIGLGELGRFAPRVAAATGLLSLHLDGAMGEQLAGERLSTLDRASGVSVLLRSGWTNSPAAVVGLLRDKSWAFDAKHGTLIIER